MNLLKETREDIAASGHNLDDIIFIGGEHSGYSCTWEEFEKLADFEYDDGFGAQEVATDLIIAFKDGSKMWREEYDGSEHWSYSRPFRMPTSTHPIQSLHVRQHKIGWCSLAEINQ